MMIGRSEIERLVWCAILLSFAVHADAQQEREIETDRDSFTPALSNVDQGLLMVESSYSFIDNRDAAETHSLPELLLRYGLTENVELRFGTNYEVGGEPNAVSSGSSQVGQSITGELEQESKVIFGIKALLLEQDGWAPKFNMIIMGNTPTSGVETASRLIVTSTFGWELPNEWEWASAIRYATGRVEEDDFNTWAPSTVIKIPLGERLNIHAEYFGLFSDGKEIESARNFFSPGVHYLITSDLEVGIRTGWGLNDQSAKFFSNVGLGWQF
jgi:hypothetical protein